MNTMTAMVIDRFGGPDVLRPQKVAVPEPGTGEVLIKVAYAGVNPADWKCREGWLAQYFHYRFPFVLGFDLAGTVVATGADVDGVAVGDPVVAYSRQGRGEWGSYAEYAVVWADGIARLPRSVGEMEAAAIPTAGITAWEGLFESGRVAAGQKVLIHGGSGGVGSYAIQLARHAGARVATTCGSQNIAYAKSLGAELVIDYRQGRMAETLSEWAPEGVDLVFDTVGQGSIPGAVALTKPGGVVAPIATLVANEAPHDAELAARKQVRIVPTMSSYERSGGQLRKLIALAGDGTLRPPHIEVMPLQKVAEAHRRVQAGHVRGKIVLRVGGEE